MSLTILNVTAAPFNAVGDGLTDDTIAIQKAFDTAFGGPTTTGGNTTPNGKTNWLNNRPVYLAARNYKITSTLTIRQLYRGLIFGGAFKWGGAPGGILLSIDGMEESRLEKLYIHGNGGGYPSFSPTGAIGLDLDLTNPASPVQLRNNQQFIGFSISNCSIGRRIANSGHDGRDNSFFNSDTSLCAIGTHIVGTAAIDNVFWASSVGTTNGTSIKCDGGSFITHGNSISTNTKDFEVNSPTPCLIAGGRNEVSGILVAIGAGATARIAGIQGEGAVAMVAGAAALIDASRIGGATGTGSLSLRSGYSPGNDPGITVVENI